jgi:hypothetical protein
LITSLSFEQDGPAANQKILLDFQLKAFGFYFSKLFGYTLQTYNLGMWPSTDVAVALLEKWEEKSPGLAKEKIGNEYVIKKKLKAALVHKFSSNTEKRKLQLKIPTKKRGM